MKYKVSADNKQFDIDITDVGNRLQVQVGDEPAVFVDFQTSGHDAVHSMLIGDQSYRLIITRKGNRHAVYTRGYRFEFTVEDERTYLMRSLIGGNAEQAVGEAKAPIPGLVSRILLQEGDVVAQGQGVVILEAMKMENEIKSPAAGTLKKVHVKAGQNVEKGQPLFLVGDN